MSNRLDDDLWGIERRREARAAQRARARYARTSFLGWMLTHLGYAVGTHPVIAVLIYTGAIFYLGFVVGGGAP